MIENFIEYMWYLLTTPFKKMKKTLNQWYTLCYVYGRRFDEVKKDILRARDEGMIAICSDEMLSVHGADRQLARYEGEQSENFRSRIAMYEEICKLGGTNEGVLLAVKTLGYVSPELVRANDLTDFANPVPDIIEDRWAEFYIIIVMNVDEEHPISFDILKKTVRKWKEVGAKDNYLFKYKLDIREINTTRFSVVQYKKYLYYFSYLKLDGKWKLDGSYTLDERRTTYNIKQQYHFSMEHTKEYRVIWHEQHNLIFLDGTWNLDGSKTIDAWQKTEVL